MKNSLLMLVVACCSLELFAATSQFQDPVRVFATSGITLRSAPDLDSRAIKIIPFGEYLSITDTTGHRSSVEWLEGQWVRVLFEGKEGYVFDGFLSGLPLPMEDYELTSRDADLSLPLISWTENNFRETAEPDSMQAENYLKSTRQFDNGITLTSKESADYLEVSLNMPGIRLGDAYNLARAMMRSSTERELFDENTLFIKNEKNLIHKITIGLDAPVEIIRIGDGIEIKVRSYQFHCGL